jgi:hypothetical protein
VLSAEYIHRWTRILILEGLVNSFPWLLLDAVSNIAGNEAPADIV